MRFKKGAKVEVLNKREVPSGSWWCSEIISGDGHTYHVRYDCCPAHMGSAIERVPRKAIRPCPPSVKGARCWVPGDIVEVYDNYSWKLGEVLRVVGRNYFFVRFLGSSMEFRVHSSDIRMRQSWQDNGWIVIRKDSGKCRNGTVNMLPKERKFICQKTKASLEENGCARDGHLTVDNNDVSSQFFSKGTNKRPRVCSLVERCAGAGKKIRTIKNEGSHRMVAANSHDLCEKVDAVVSAQKVLDEKYMHASLNNRIGFSETQGGEGITNSDGNRYFRVNSEPIDTESVTSSVGSCSANNSPYRSLHCPVNSLTEDLDSCPSDAEIYCLGRELSLPTKEAPREDIHQLELHAYRTTLMALYASGPISWDQEALMTNLRCMLHISNDEHLLELRDLVYGEKDVSFR